MGKTAMQRADERHDQWCETLWQTLRDGGSWAIPAAGLLLVKDAAARELRVVACLAPPERDHAADLRQLQAQFSRIGIQVRAAQ